MQSWEKRPARGSGQAFLPAADHRHGLLPQHGRGPQVGLSPASLWCGWCRSCEGSGPVTSMWHRDVKLEHVLLDSTQHLVKLAGFGYAKRDDDSACKSRVGTPDYVGAPSIVHRARHVTACLRAQAALFTSHTCSASPGPLRLQLTPAAGWASAEEKYQF